MGEQGGSDEQTLAKPMLDTWREQISQYLSSHSMVLLRGGVMGLAGVMGFASLVCGVLAVCLYIRPDLRR
jgi:hypothetical protein